MAKYSNNLDKVWEAIQNIQDYIENDAPETSPFIVRIYNNSPYAIDDENFIGEFYLCVTEHSPVLKDLWQYKGFFVNTISIDNGVQVVLNNEDYSLYMAVDVIIPSQEDGEISVGDVYIDTNNTKYSDSALSSAFKALVKNIPWKNHVDYER